MVQLSDTYKIESEGGVLRRESRRLSTIAVVFSVFLRASDIHTARSALIDDPNFAPNVWIQTFVLKPQSLPQKTEPCYGLAHFEASATVSQMLVLRGFVLQIWLFIFSQECFFNIECSS